MHLPKVDFKLKNLFYTEVVNYSHYAYNSKEIGEWIDGLFHKNDSYQTPLVLNPMREEGNFDINTENDLVKQRLLSNLLRKKETEDNADFRKFGDNIEAYELKLEEGKKKSIVKYGYDKSIKKDKIIEVDIFDSYFKLSDLIIDQLLSYYFKKEIVADKKHEHYEISKSYILYKIISISTKYEEYSGYKDYFVEAQKKYEVLKDNDFLDNEEEKEELAKIRGTFPIVFLQDLVGDNSHITFKLKQTLNYLVNDYLHYSSHGMKPYDIEDLSGKINDLKTESNSIIELIPPPIFKTDIILKPINGVEKEDIPFSSLSSGEKQLIYSVSSILYHLINLNSVSQNKIQYRNINLVLEEIELYFHPEYQKKYILYLLNSIKRINLDRTDSINIILATHSPFILSDIPASNILFLDKGSPVKLIDRQTFGANIHDLLADSFFFGNKEDDKALVGDFAKKKIEEVIKWLLIRDVKVRDPSKKEEYKKIIDLIGEPIVRHKLTEMYLDTTKDADLINKEIERLKKLLPNANN